MIKCWLLDQELLKRRLQGCKNFTEFDILQTQILNGKLTQFVREVHIKSDDDFEGIQRLLRCEQYGPIEMPEEDGSLLLIDTYVRGIDVEDPEGEISFVLKSGVTVIGSVLCLHMDEFTQELQSTGKTKKEFVEMFRNSFSVTYTGEVIWPLKLETKAHG